MVPRASGGPLASDVRGGSTGEDTVTTGGFGKALHHDHCAQDTQVPQQGALLRREAWEGRGIGASRQRIPSPGCSSSHRRPLSVPLAPPHGPPTIVTREGESVIGVERVILASATPAD